MRGLTLACAVVALASWATDASGQNTRNAAVLAVGDDGALVGQLQVTLEQRLRDESGIHLIPAADVARTLRVPQPPEPDPNAEELVARQKLLKDAQNDFYMGRQKDALTSLKRLVELQGQHDRVPIKERIVTYLWYASTYISLKEMDRARVMAERAVALDPELQVDLNVFRPSLADLVDDVRTSGLQMVQVTIRVPAADAEVSVDDRPTRSGQLSIPRGPHLFQVEAPGFQTLRTVVDVDANRTITLVPPLLAPPALDSAMRSLVARGQTNEADEARLEELSKRLDVDVIVIAGIRQSPFLARGILWQWDARDPMASERISDPNGAIAALSSWLGGAIRDDGGGGVGFDGSGGGGNGGGGTTYPRRTTFDIEATGGLSFAARRYFLQSTQGGGTDVTFFGVGPRVSLNVDYNGTFAEATFAYQTYGVLRPTVTFPNGETRTINGGSNTAGSLAVGYSYGLMRAALHLRGWVGGNYETHSAGTEVERFPAYTRSSLDVGAGASYRTGPLIFEGAATLTPVSAWQENPTGTTGDDPATSLHYGWRVGARFEPTESWRVRAGYRGEQRTVRFSGESATTFDPPMVDGLLQETVHLFTFSVDHVF